jgi:hypothetical protein
MTLPQYGGIVILIKCVSMMSSSPIVRRHTRTSSTPTSHKVSLTQTIMLCLCIGDFFSSLFVPAISSWKVPSDVPIYLSSGNNESCTAEGFMSQFFYGLSVLSNATLGVSHCLLVRFGWNYEGKQHWRFPYTLTR